MIVGDNNDFISSNRLKKWQVCPVNTGKNEQRDCI